MTHPNKILVKNVAKELKNLGYEVKVGHLYEVLSRAAGFASWNHAAASGVDFSKLIDLTPPANTKRINYPLE